MENTTTVLISMPQSTLADLDGLMNERAAELGSRPNRSETIRFLLIEYRKAQKKPAKKSAKAS